MIGNTNTAPVTEIGRTYQTRQSADDAALRLALRDSPTRRAHVVPFVGAYTAKEGGRAYEHCVLPEGWGAREIPADELARRVQSGLRREIDRLLEEAQVSAKRYKQLLAAGKAPDSTFARMHRRDAQRSRDRARELETQIVVALAVRAS